MKRGMEIDRFQMNMVWREIHKCSRDEFRGSADLEIDRFGKTGDRRISGVAMRETIPDGFLICSCVMVG